MCLPPVNSFMASASASIDSISKLFVGSSCKRHRISSLSGFQKAVERRLHCYRTFARPFPRVEKLGMKSLPMPIGSFFCPIGQFGSRH